MNSTNQHPILSRAVVVNALSKFRQEWNEIAGEETLIDAEASVGLLLSDIIDLLGLTNAEREAVLGSELTRQIKEFMSSPILAIE